MTTVPDPAAQWEDLDALRRYALDVKREHDPKHQEDNPYDRCAHCHYTRHPCEVYDLAAAVLMLLDRGRTDDPWETADGRRSAGEVAMDAATMQFREMQSSNPWDYANAVVKALRAAGRISE